MISKNISVGNKVAKSQGGRMKALLDYVDQLENIGHLTKPHVFHLNAMDEQTADMEMVALSEVNPLAVMPVRHIVVSWKEHEAPTPAQALEAAKIVLKETGAENCMAKCSLQYDTDNVHLHIILCTVDPDTHKMVKTPFIEDRLGQAVAIIEHQQGWQPEVNARFSVLENGELVKNLQDGNELVRKKALHEKAARLERYSGERSALDIAQVEVPIIMKDKKVASWDAFHTRLASKGLGCELVQLGAVFKVYGDGAAVAVKASEADRNASFGKLEKRFGKFEPAGPCIAIKSRSIEPAESIKGSAREKYWREYMEAKKQHAAVESRDALKARQASELKALKEQQKEQRDDVFKQKDKFGKMVSIPRDVLNSMRSVMAEQQADEIAVPLHRHKQELERAEHDKFPDFENYLVRRGLDDLAHEQRYSARPVLLSGAEPKPVSEVLGYQAVTVDTETHYRSEGRTAFVDHGKSVSFEEWHKPAPIKAGLQMAAEKWPDGFELRGNGDFKAAACREAVALGVASKVLNDDMQGYLQDIEQERKAAMETTQPEPMQQYLDAVQPDKIRVQCRRMGEYNTGRNLTHVDGVQPDNMPWPEIEKEAAKRHKNGDREHLFITPLSEKMHHILIDDLDQAKIDKLKADGYSPTAIIESSPGNYQVVINVPKQSDDEETNRLVEKELTHRFNWPTKEGAAALLDQAKASGIERKIKACQIVFDRVQRPGEEGFGYGDPHLVGPRHPHRIPGIPNNKPKNLQPDGSYALVRVAEAKGGTCHKAAQLAQELMQRAQQQVQAKRAHDAQVDATMQLDFTQQPQMAVSRPGSPAPAPLDKATESPRIEAGEASRKQRAIYEAHRADVMKRNRGADDVAVDLMIAQRLVKTGHSSSEIAAMVDSCTLSPRPKPGLSGSVSVSHGYGQRTADKAFSPASVAAIDRQAKYHGAWQLTEGKAVAKIDKVIEAEAKAAAFEAEQKAYQEQQKAYQEQQARIETSGPFSSSGPKMH